MEKYSLEYSTSEEVGVKKGDKEANRFRTLSVNFDNDDDAKLFQVLAEKYAVIMLANFDRKLLKDGIEFVNLPQGEISIQEMFAQSKTGRVVKVTREDAIKFIAKERGISFDKAERLYKLMEEMETEE